MQVISQVQAKRMRKQRKLHLVSPVILMLFSFKMWTNMSRDGVQAGNYPSTANDKHQISWQEWQGHMMLLGEDNGRQSVQGMRSSKNKKSRQFFNLETGRRRSGTTRTLKKEAQRAYSTTHATKSIHPLEV
eukprot:217348-Pelagomonas_calceolata.AAC.6